MKTEPQKESPFAALTYQEQQDRWLEWRSRQLDYQPAAAPPQQPTEKAEPSAKPAPMPGMRMPNFAVPAPTRHEQLDRVLARHSQAVKKTGMYRPAGSSWSAPPPKDQE